MSCAAVSRDCGLKDGLKTGVLLRYCHKRLKQSHDAPRDGGAVVRTKSHKNTTKPTGYLFKKFPSNPRRMLSPRSLAQRQKIRGKTSIFEALLYELRWQTISLFKLYHLSFKILGLEFS